jgi:hypothetical protein
MNAASFRRLAALCALALLVAACEHRASINDPKIDNDAFDRQIVQQLTDVGADLTRPARVLYSLYIPKRSDADAAARELLAAGYRATVQPPAGMLPDGKPEKRWWLVATNQAVPSLDHARRIRPYMDALARRYHGEYAGWGVQVIK